MTNYSGGGYDMDDNEIGAILVAAGSIGLLWQVILLSSRKLGVELMSYNYVF